MSKSSIPILDYAAVPQRRVRFLIWVICVALLLVGTTGWLLFLREWRILQADLTLVGGWFAIGIVILAVAILLKTTPLDAIRLSGPSGRSIVLLGATGLQLAALALVWPVLSEDLIRYRLDGLMWLKGYSPYASTPSEFKRQTSLVDAIDEMVTFPHLSTIYPPVAQAAFAAARAIDDLPGLNLGAPIVGNQWRGWTHALPGLNRTFVLRFISAAASVGATWILLMLLSSRGLSPWHAVLFAWNPLTVLETGGMGHLDIVGVLFVLLAIRAIQSGRPILSSAMLALSAGVKPPVLLLAPFLLRDAKARDPRARPAWIAMALIGFVFLVFVPALAYQRGYEGWFRTLRTYANEWEANGSIYNLIKAIPDSTDGVAIERYKDHARTFAAIATGVTLLLAWWRRARLAEAGYWIFLVALLVSPVVYPWYLLWILCFVPLLRGWQGITALVWSATIGISYLLWRTDDWVLPTMWLLVEYVPVYLALLLELILITLRDAREGEAPAEPGSPEARGSAGASPSPTSLLDPAPPASLTQTSAP